MTDFKDTRTVAEKVQQLHDNNLATSDVFMSLIGRGRFDRSLSQFEEAIRRRRERVAQKFADELVVGDRVKLKDIGMGAKYLNGAPATVTGHAIKNVKVSIDRSWDTRRYSHDLRIPPENLERLLPSEEKSVAMGVERALGREPTMSESQEYEAGDIGSLEDVLGGRE